MKTLNYSLLQAGDNLLRGLIRAAPVLLCIAWALLLFGLYKGLYATPADALQGELFRIIYVHVPAASLSLFIYTVIGINSLIYIIAKIQICYEILKSSLYFGMANTVIALCTGAIWGKPSWGAWWVWDARLTAELILLFTYIAIIGLKDALEDDEKSKKMVSVLAALGFLNVPIVHFSVNWWHTLHQPASLSKFSMPTIAPEMLMPLLLAMVGGYMLYMAIIGLQLKKGRGKYAIRI